MGRETETLDALADGQFQPKLADPSDTLTKRGGKGHVYFQGVCYTRLAWIRRIAALGGTLAAGEGAVLDAELTRVTAMVEAAYREGYEMGESDAIRFPTGAVGDAWTCSDAYWLLHGEEA